MRVTYLHDLPSACDLQIAILVIPDIAKTYNPSADTMIAVDCIGAEVRHKVQHCEQQQSFKLDK